MPLDMPESVLVRFKGKMQPGVTLRDLVNAIPLYAIKQGLLTVAKQGKKNVFSGVILEIEGLPDLKVEQAFELSDASAERSAAGCTVALNKEPIIEYINSNITLLKYLIAEGYSDARTIRRRIKAMEAWLANPHLLKADKAAEYAAVIDIDLAEIHEPIVACPNDPDDVKTLSEVAGSKIDEVFIGSCMTNIGHFRAASKLLEGKRDMPVKLWMAPPTMMDKKILTEEGHYGTLGGAGARMELPGCSLCMGNQAQVREGATVFSTSTRNFPNRLGKGANVYLGSAELAAICSKLGRIPTREEYLVDMGVLTAASDKVYKYLNFDQIDDFTRGDARASPSDRWARSHCPIKTPAHAGVFFLHLPAQPAHPRDFFRAEKFGRKALQLGIELAPDEFGRFLLARVARPASTLSFAVHSPPHAFCWPTTHPLTPLSLSGGGGGGEREGGGGGEEEREVSCCFFFCFFFFFFFFFVFSQKLEGIQASRTHPQGGGSPSSPPKIWSQNSGGGRVPPPPPHTHTHIYIYIYICIYPPWPLWPTPPPRGGPTPRTWGGACVTAGRGEETAYFLKAAF